MYNILSIQCVIVVVVFFVIVNIKNYHCICVIELQLMCTVCKPFKVTSFDTSDIMQQWKCFLSQIKFYLTGNNRISERLYKNAVVKLKNHVVCYDVTVQNGCL